MYIFNLPKELLREILYRSVLARGMKRGLRLRLVCKEFATEIIEVLYGYRLLDAYLASLDVYSSSRALPPFTSSYLEYRVRNREGDRYQLLHYVFCVASGLSSENDALSFDDCLHIVCSHACSSPLWKCVKTTRTIFSTESDTIRSNKKNFQDQLPISLFVAAIATNTTAIVQRRVDECDTHRGTRLMEDDWLLGPSMQLAGRFANEGTLALLLHDEQEEVHQDRRALLFVAAAQAGRLDAIRFIHDFRCSLVPWKFARGLEEYGTCQPLKESLSTPSRAVWGYVMELRERYSRPTHLTPYELVELLSKSAAKGWLEMVDLLLELGGGTSLPNCLPWFQVPGWRLPLLEACAAGHFDVVRSMLRHRPDTGVAVSVAAAHGRTDIIQLLLTHGADTVGALTRASRRGYIEIVRKLLNAGVDANEEDKVGRLAFVDLPADFERRGDRAVEQRSRVPLLCAVQMEHVQLVRLLVERGAKVSDQSVHFARAHALESMAELLKELKNEW